MIGIKTADGQFYPIFQEKIEKKEIILTSAHKNQDKVKIDFFQYNEDDMSEQYHLGSLRLDRIQSDSSGNSEICLNVETDGRTLKAQAQDNISGTVSAMKTDIPAPDHYDRAMDPIPVAVPEKKSQDSSLRGIKAILAAIIVMILILSCFMFFTIMSRPVVIHIPDTQEMPPHHGYHYHHCPTPVLPHDHPMMHHTYPAVPEPAVPETEAEQSQLQPSQPVQQPLAESVPVSDPVIQPEAVPAEEPAAESEAAPTDEPIQVSEEKHDFFRYTIRKGDTLWSLARKFYNDPYRYTDIMHDNGISSRDQITSGTKILIRNR